jgi:hypothetical protein
MTILYCKKIINTDNLQRKTTSNWRRPLIEDDLKIVKVEYLSNHLLDHTQILKLSFYEQTMFCKSFKWRRPPMEDDLKISKVKYLSNLLLDPTKILNLSLYDQIILYKFFKWRRPPIKDNFKILKVEYLSNHVYRAWKV